jgi:hypothetical protein
MIWAQNLAMLLDQIVELLSAVAGQLHLAAPYHTTSKARGER